MLIDEHEAAERLQNEEVREKAELTRQKAAAVEIQKQVELELVWMRTEAVTKCAKG